MNHLETSLGDDPVPVKLQVAERCDPSSLYSLPWLRGPPKLQVFSRQNGGTLCEGLAHEQVFLAELGVGFEAFPLIHSHRSKPESPRPTFLRSRRVRLDYSPPLISD